MSLDQYERFKWSREQAQKLILHMFSHNCHNYSMFRNVPECSGMFHVPDFIDGRIDHSIRSECEGRLPREMLLIMVSTAPNAMLIVNINFCV